MLSLLGFALLTSLVLGMRHATDPDHVLAVSTIVSEERSLTRAAGIGALWGIGHTLTVLLVGAAIIMLRLELSPRLGLSMEFAVAVMLIVLGCLNLLDVKPSGGRLTTMRPMLVGIVHGLAGSAAATLLVLPLIPDPRWAVAYLLVFGLGTVAGMAVMTIVVAAPSVFAATRVAGMRRWIRIGSGALSVCFGLWLAHRIGFTDGLFTDAPRWTPQ